MPTINALMAMLVAELTEEGIAAPLAQRFTLATIWTDLARLAGEELPAEALAVVGPALDVTYQPVRGGGYADHALRFTPAD